LRGLDRHNAHYSDYLKLTAAKHAVSSRWQFPAAVEKAAEGLQLVTAERILSEEMHKARPLTRKKQFSASTEYFVNKASANQNCCDDNFNSYNDSINCYHNSHSCRRNK